MCAPSMTTATAVCACIWCCCSGQPIPRIEYTAEEAQVWGTALSKLKALFPTHACTEFNHSFPKFDFRCGV